MKKEEMKEKSQKALDGIKKATNMLDSKMEESKKRLGVYQAPVSAAIVILLVVAVVDNPSLAFYALAIVGILVLPHLVESLKVRKTQEKVVEKIETVAKAEKEESEKK